MQPLDLFRQRYIRAGSFNERGADYMPIDPILVVSDTHIGFQPKSAERFAHFLQWVGDRLRPAEGDGQNLAGLPITTLDGVQKNLKAPKTLVLLGDFLDMWAPRNADYTSPVRDGYGILDVLFHLPCDKIYVPGNHDDVAARYVRIYPDQNNHPFTVVPKYYPQEAVKQGVQIGGLTYFFLHGHQFSKLWGVPVLKFFDFVGRTSYESYEVSPGALLVGIAVLAFSVLLGIYSWIFPSWLSLLGQLPTAAAALLAIVWVTLGVLGFFGFGGGFKRRIFRFTRNRHVGHKGRGSRSRQGLIDSLAARNT